MKRLALISAAMMMTASAGFALPSPDVNAAELMQASDGVPSISDVEVTPALTALLEIGPDAKG